MTVLVNMRKFHNDIKKNYLKEYIEPGSFLLDLATGKGGDLYKWLYNKNIRAVDGFDINPASIEEAIRRRNNAVIKKKINFFVQDLSKNVLNCSIKYDAITINFALHYFFKNKITLDNILKTIKNCSKKGTVLITTLFDGCRVDENVESENFYIKHLNNKEIEVYIKDAVLSTPTVEYIVKSSTLIHKMASIGFVLVETKTFDQLYDKKYNLTEEEKNLSFRNRVYVFIKKV